MKRRETENASKLLTIIADMFNLKKDELQPETKWSDINISDKDKTRVLNRLAEKFKLKINSTEIKNIKTIYEALQFVEGSKNFNNNEN